MRTIGVVVYVSLCFALSTCIGVCTGMSPNSVSMSLCCLHACKPNIMILVLCVLMYGDSCYCRFTMDLLTNPTLVMRMQKDLLIFKTS